MNSLREPAPGRGPAAYGSSPAFEPFHRATGTMNSLREPAPGRGPAAYGSSPAFEPFHRATGTMNSLREPGSHPLGAVGSGFGFWISCAVVGSSGGRPLRSFCCTCCRSSGSGFRSRAWLHWKVASSLRPTRQ